MSYKLGKTSLRRLEGVNQQMRDVVEQAIQITEVDFSVVEGLRTQKRQDALLARGATTVTVSQHQHGLAVDLVPYINGARWEFAPMIDVASAMSKAANRARVKLRWGGCWRMIWDKPYSANALADMVAKYQQRRIAKGYRPFVDAWHFEVRQ